MNKRVQISNTLLSFLQATMHTWYVFLRTTNKEEVNAKANAKMFSAIHRTYIHRNATHTHTRTHPQWRTQSTRKWSNLNSHTSLKCTRLKWTQTHTINSQMVQLELALWEKQQNHFVLTTSTAILAHLSASEMETFNLISLQNGDTTWKEPEVSLTVLISIFFWKLVTEDRAASQRGAISDLSSSRHVSIVSSHCHRHRTTIQSEAVSLASNSQSLG